METIATGHTVTETIQNNDVQEIGIEQNGMETEVQNEPSERNSVLNRMAALSQAGGAFNVIQPMNVKQIRTRISEAKDEKVSQNQQEVQQPYSQQQQPTNTVAVTTSRPSSTTMPESSSQGTSISHEQNVNSNQETALTVYDEAQRDTEKNSSSPYESVPNNQNQNKYQNQNQIHSQEYLNPNQNFSNMRMGMNDMGSSNIFYKLESMHSDIILMKDAVNRINSNAQYNNVSPSHMHPPGTPVSPSSISSNMHTQPAMYTKMGGKYSSEEWLGSFRMLLDDYEKLEKDSKDTPDKLATYMEKVTTLQEKNTSLMEKLMNRNEEYGTLEKLLHDKTKEFEENTKSLTTKINLLEDNLKTLDLKDQQSGKDAQKILELQEEKIKITNELQELKTNQENQLQELKATQEQEKSAMEEEKKQLQKSLEEQILEKENLTCQMKTMISMEEAQKRNEENNESNKSSTTNDTSPSNNEEITKLQDTIQSLQTLLEERTEKLKSLENLQNRKVEATEEKEIVSPEKEKDIEASKTKLQHEERQQMMQNIYLAMESKFSSCSQEDTFNSKQILKLLKKILRETVTVAESTEIVEVNKTEDGSSSTSV